jgi:hypothetical protein
MSLTDFLKWPHRPLLELDSDAGLHAHVPDEEVIPSKPIRVMRFPMDKPLAVKTGEFVTGRLTHHRNGRLLYAHETPRFAVQRDMTIDHFLKIEVIDEFGMDVGFGFIYGQAKKEQESQP